MKSFNHLKGFNSFSKVLKLNEMASNLMSIPEFRKRPELMRFIHTLSSEAVSRGAGKEGLRRGGRFRTQEKDVAGTPGGYYGGDWPAHQDFRLSHDVAVKGQKTGKDRIYQWLDSLDKKKDTDPHAILVTPDEIAPMIWYLTKKTGTMSPAERKAAFGTDDRSVAWEKGISVKAGYFMRAITIDAETGEPTATWTGTIGQLMKYVNDDSVLYIMEDERRAVEKAQKRKEENTLGMEKFINYFKGEYLNILNRAWSKKTDKKSQDFKRLTGELEPGDMGGIDPSIERQSVDLSPKLRELIELAQEIGSGEFNTGDLQVHYKKWLEYMAEAGDYVIDPSFRDPRAEISDIIRKHTMMGACNRFLQYIVSGKVTGAHMDVLKQLGVETGIDLGTTDVDLSDIDI